MSIEVSPITVEQKDKILALKESHFADLKSKDISPAKLTKTVSGFANADGGELYIGIDEDKATNLRRWRGFSNQEEANGHIQTLEGLFPLGQFFTYEFLECVGENGLVLLVGVRKTPDVKSASDRIPYERRGAQTLPANTQDRLDRLRYAKGVTSFETAVIDADVNLITNSIPILEFMIAVVPLTEPRTWLEKQQMIRGDKPTVAGILLFAEEPQAILPKRSAIKLYRYRTKDEEGTRESMASDPITIEGCIYDLISNTVKKTVELVESVPVLGEEGLVKIQYPEITLHEIITNAVLHRDYSIPNDVHIRVFDNRIEVESPGRLPAHITPKNILKERFLRNGAIVRLINKFPDPPNKDVGEGLNTAFRAMLALRLKVPVITETENSVLVTIRHESLASPEETVMTYLEHNLRITNQQARDLCAIESENTMKNVFYRLRDRGMIELIPGLRGRNAAWRKRTSGQNR